MLEGDLVMPPEDAQGILLFGQGSGSSRHHPRNRYYAHMMREAGFATLLIDLLTLDEEIIDLRAKHFHFDINLLSARLVSVTDWLTQNPDTRNLKIGYFGSNTGGGAALVAAAERSDAVGAIVARSGWLELVGSALSCVQAPTLLIVGEYDLPLICTNEDALAQLRVEKRLEIIPGATQLFHESGALEEVARLASQWFKRYLTSDNVQASHLPSY